MNPFALSSLLVVLTVLPLGYFVYIQNKQQWANKIWFIYSISLTFWGYFGMLIGITDNPTHALLYWRIAMGLGIIWMPVLFYHFAYLYAPFTDKREKKFLIGAYIITTLLAISAFTPLYIPKVVYMFDSLYWARPSIAFYILTIWWFVMTGYSHTKLYKVSRTMPKERQNQITYFIIASGVAYIGGFHNFSIVYGLNIYPWTNFLIVLYPFIMTYAIIAHGLFDIFIFIKRIFYSAILVGVIAWVIGSISFISGLLQNRFGLPTWAIPLLAAMVSLYVVYVFLQKTRASDRAKQEFITIAAHKLRTPLTHIHYIADELKQVQTPAETAALAVNLEESTAQLIDLVNKVLDVANLETQSEKYQFNPIDLKVLTDKVMEKVGPNAQHKKIAVNIHVAEAVPKVEGYEKTLKFVIQSLLENAVIYTPENGSITVDISTDGKELTWSIQDSGIGIAKEDVEKVFDKFFRGQNALKTDTEGTGLALSISRNLIKRQGGMIHVFSEGIGLGTRFWFTLPIGNK